MRTYDTFPDTEVDENPVLQVEFSDPDNGIGRSVSYTKDRPQYRLPPSKGAPADARIPVSLDQVLSGALPTVEDAIARYREIERRWGHHRPTMQIATEELLRITHRLGQLSREML